MTELYESCRKARQAKRRDNRAFSTDLLREHGIPFVSRNMGAHLIVTYKEKVVDFWPGTGRFIIRGEHTKQRGVRVLLKVLGVAK